jgi:hypothetical protein
MQQLEIDPQYFENDLDELYNNELQQLTTKIQFMKALVEAEPFKLQAHNPDLKAECNYR